ncbi:MAG: hypothetical protein QXV69_09845 [Sulfolobaceae archaeon]
MAFPELATTIILFLISWILVSIPIWFAAKVISPSNATFGRALIASLSGFIIFSIFSALFSTLGLGIIGTIIAFVILLAVYKSIFSTGWLGALGIIVIAFIITFIIAIILGFLFGISILLFRL